jgi:hypothetical protein
MTSRDDDQDPRTVVIHGQPQGTPTTVMTTQQTAVQPALLSTRDEEEPEKESAFKKALPIVVVTVSILLIPFLIWFFLLRGNGGDEPKWTNIKENRINFVQKDNEVHLNELLKDTQWNNTPFIKKYTDWDAADQDLTVDERAILNTQDKLKNGKPVNILVGTQYALSTSSYSQQGMETYDKSVRHPDEYYNPIMYIERRDDDRHVVLVTADWMSSQGADDYLDSVNGAREAFIETPEGKVFVDSSDVRWTAREFGKCWRLPENLNRSSWCVYKRQQQRPRVSFNNYDQVILTAPVSHANGAAWYSVLLHGNAQVPVGAYYPSDHSDTSVEFTQADEILGLIDENGPPMGAEDLYQLPEFTLPR